MNIGGGGDRERGRDREREMHHLIGREKGGRKGEGGEMIPKRD